MDMRGGLVAVVLAMAIVLGATVPTWAGTPPEPEPPDEWDKSSIAVSGACVEGVPTFTIVNHGNDMTGPISWYMLDIDGGASDCAADVAGGYVDTGVLQLAADESATVEGTGTTPMRLCVEQRPGHPGTGWASATISAEDVKACATAEDVVGEPGRLRWLFVPWVRGR